MVVNIYEAKTKLSKLLKRAQKGEEIVIARAGEPIARLIPIAREDGTRSGVRFGGIKASELGISDEFYQPLSDDDLLSS